MSLSHECECRVCGHKMKSPLPGAVFMNTNMAGAPMPPITISGWFCTKHGAIYGPDCEQCRMEAKP